ncbi:MAG: SDR family oxidoreductase [Thermoanaerobaculia bacterium]
MARIARGTTRRDFLRTGAAAGAALGLARTGFASLEVEKPAAKRLLILGGTAFLGPELVEEAKRAGWTVTLFNRGKTNPHLFPEVEKLRGDRRSDLKALEGRSWDAVVDTSGYFPRDVAASARLLSKSVGLYVFISTISVYGDTSKPGIDEGSPVAKTDQPDADKVTGANYGALKALCEEAARKEMPGKVTVIRPGLIIGPGDTSDRFTYWPVRVARGGEVLAPGTPDDPVQFVDVRDLASWTVEMIGRRRTGVFNATGPREPLTFGPMLAACREASGAQATFTWVDAKTLEELKIAPWSDMPCWVPPFGETAGSRRVNNGKAVGEGLTFRPIVETARDTLAWWRTLPEERRSRPKAGLTPEREAAALAAVREMKAKA